MIIVGLNAVAKLQRLFLIVVNWCDRNLIADRACHIAVYRLRRQTTCTLNFQQLSNLSQIVEDLILYFQPFLFGLRFISHGN